MDCLLLLLNCGPLWTSVFLALDDEQLALLCPPPLSVAAADLWISLDFCASGSPLCPTSLSVYWLLTLWNSAPLAWKAPPTLDDEQVKILVVVKLSSMLLTSHMNFYLISILTQFWVKFVKH